jgi:methionine synthase II (cobalamin-independent)
VPRELGTDKRRAVTTQWPIGYFESSTSKFLSGIRHGSGGRIRAASRFVPKEKAVVLGLISSKQREFEPADEIKRRIDEASRYVERDRLCLSPQFDFACSCKVSRFTADDQERKLAHIVTIASEVCG